MEKIITFLNNNNEKLFGILHIPDSNNGHNRNKQKTGIHILNIGSDRRCGPARLNVKIARQLTKRGFHVFRCDVSGVGDSEGSLSGNNNEHKYKLFEEIQKGKFTSDTLLANAVFMKEAKVDKLIVLGISGGAVTAIFTGLKDKNIDAVIAISMPVNITSTENSFFDHVNELEKTSSMFMFYIKKIVSRQAWTNLLRFNSDFSVFYKLPKALWNKMYNKISTVVTNSKKIDFPERFNKPLFEAFTSLIKNRKKVYFIYPEIDEITSEFQQSWQSNFINNNKQCKSLTDCKIIEGTSHLYADKRCNSDQSDLFRTINQYIDDYCLNNNLAENIAAQHNVDPEHVNDLFNDDELTPAWF